MASFDAPARECGVCVVPAAGFFGGFGDLLASYAMNGSPCADSIDVGIARSSWWPTRGTRDTGRRNTAPRFKLCDGVLKELQPAAPPAPWNFPEPFGM